MQTVVVANYFDGEIGSGGYRTDSFVYKVEEDGSGYTLLQRIATYGAMDVATFRVGEESWLAIANFFDGEKHTLTSPLLRWSPALHEFEVQHAVDATAALQWQHLKCGGSHFLVLLQTPPLAANLSAVGMVRVWKLSDGDLVWIQDIATSQGTGLAGSDVDGMCLLVVTADCGGCSVLYRYNGTVFANAQTLSSTASSVGAQFLSLGGQNLLSVTENSGVRLFSVRTSNAATILVPFSGFTDTDGQTGVRVDSSQTLGVARHVVVQGFSYFVLPSAEDTLVFRVRGRGLVGGQESAVAESVNGRVSWVNMAAAQQLAAEVGARGWEFSAEGVDSTTTVTSLL
eukprot:1880776-Rhodomonas_salina.2